MAAKGALNARPHLTVAERAARGRPFGFYRVAAKIMAYAAPREVLLEQRL